MDFAAAQKKLATLSNDFQTLQAELQKQVATRQRLDAQLSENEQVKKEFAKLSPNNQVYKLIGPALVKQDQSEAKANVEKRIEFINNEITRVEDKLKDLSKKMEGKRNEIVELQAKAQAARAGGGGAGPAPQTAVAS
ncbi:Prefoldin subunit 6 [Tilletia horrida]|uniref:Prefoldin subunit 6 n=1 Tax=Tilletia horrida TaxID=155126 RepID=A0AAN6GIP2_9BASI|nr:Prefoldin subunit 6 [Tilletia horrida]KAK0539770.1 Prefoldin subunit 6 [Tilletia horrida]KAK0565485.1 Prefoldin subunit 6 [Tilletia horrida]